MLKSAEISVSLWVLFNEAFQGFHEQKKSSQEEKTPSTWLWTTLESIDMPFAIPFDHYCTAICSPGLARCCRVTNVHLQRVARISKKSWCEFLTRSIQKKWGGKHPQKTPQKSQDEMVLGVVYIYIFFGGFGSSTRFLSSSFDLSRTFTLNRHLACTQFGSSLLRQGARCHSAGWWLPVDLSPGWTTKQWKYWAVLGGLFHPHLDLKHFI